MAKHWIGSIFGALASSILIIVLPLTGKMEAQKNGGGLRFAISFPAGRSQAALDGPTEVGLFVAQEEDFFDRRAFQRARERTGKEE